MGRLLRAAAVALAVTIAACGGSDVPAVLTPAPAAGTPAPAAATATPGAEPGTAELTPPGTQLEPGDTARVDLSSLSEQTWRVWVTVLAFERGQPKDLANFDIPADQRKHVPYYLRVRIANRSKRRFADTVEPSTHLTAVDDLGAEAHSLLLIGDFPRCDQYPPGQNKRGATYVICNTYLLPPGRSIARVQWEVQSGGDPIVWKP